MSFASKVLARLFGLPTATHATTMMPLKIPMPDGVTLCANLHAPVGVNKAPLLLVRSPYGRAGMLGVSLGELFAERGWQSLIVSVRGTFGSGGKLVPFHQEKADGLSVLDWMRAQPWYPGGFTSFGPSYMGLTQWAIAAAAGDDLKGMFVQISASDFRRFPYSCEGFALEDTLAWADLMLHQERSLSFLRGLYNPGRARGVMHLPLNEADRVVTGHTVDFFQQWLVHNAPNDPWWQPSMHQDTLGQIKAPVAMCTGFFDMFLPAQLEDYARLRAAGNTPRLIIGPWTHSSLATSSEPFRQALMPDAGSRIFVSGAEEWRPIESWPPPSTPLRWELPIVGAYAAYRYDPADPTPSVGGAVLRPGHGGSRDNRKLEARPDVLTYTSDVLSEDLDVIGTPEVELFVQSSVTHTDFFARLCDVHPDGRSMNVCDAIVRSENPQHLRFALWPTAHRFKRGHRYRVQISSGAHPRYARNLGTGEPLATSVRMRVAEQKVFPKSAIVLPVVSPR